jgi:hypothetical protein
LKKKWRIIAVIPLFLLILFAFTYIPHNFLNLDPSDVSRITVFDGNTGLETEITDRDAIQHIINNLNTVTTQKGKPSFGYMGYSFRTTIFDQKGKELKEFIINSDDTIRYRGFFHRAADHSIDYEYIEKLVRK